MLVTQCCLVSDASRCSPTMRQSLTKLDQGQGGAQCIEDSAALGLVFCGAGRADVRARLQLYEQIRRNRASLMQVFSNAGQDEPELIHREAAKYIPSEEVPSMSIPRTLSMSEGLKQLTSPCRNTRTILRLQHGIRYHRRLSEPTQTPRSFVRHTPIFLRKRTWARSIS